MNLKLNRTLRRLSLSQQTIKVTDAMEGRRSHRFMLVSEGVDHVIRHKTRAGFSASVGNSKIIASLMYESALMLPVKHSPCISKATSSRHVARGKYRHRFHDLARVMAIHEHTSLRGSYGRMSDGEDSAAPALPLGRIRVIQIRPYGPILFAPQTFALRAISSFYFDIASVVCNGRGPIGWSGLVRMNDFAHM